MNRDEVSSASDVARSVCRSKALPSVPPVLMTIMAKCSDEDVEFGELGALISSDPALAARILGMANSCHFGGRTKIKSIRTALTRLGLRLTHATVLGFALTSRMKPSAGFDADHFWRYALTTSNAARALAKETRLQDPDDALAAGLLQDVGMLALECVLPEEYQTVRAECGETGELLHAAEERVLGTTHMDVGAQLLRQWHLPEELYEPILHHHSLGGPAWEALPEGVRNMAGLLRMADMVAHMFVGPDRNIAHSTVLRTLDDEFGLAGARAQPMLEQVSAAVDAAAGAFDLDPDSLPSYDDIKASTVGKMIDLATEMEAGFRDYQAQAATARRALAELETRHREVSRQAAYDELTDVLSRGEFMRRLEAEVGRASSKELPLALMFLDIDHFKWVNDRLGHLAGDTVLKSFGKYLSHGLRRLDSVGRYGGDEFVVLLVETELPPALEVARRLRGRIASLSREWLEDFDGITISIGLAHVEAVGKEMTPARLLQEADQCLYGAKVEGRNCIRYCSI